MLFNINILRQGYSKVPRQGENLVGAEELNGGRINFHSSKLARRSNFTEQPNNTTLDGVAT